MTHPTLAYFPISDIVVSPEAKANARANARAEIGPLDGLTQTVKRWGILENVGLVRIPGGVKAELIFGRRRYESAKEAGLLVVPAQIWDVTLSDEEADELAAIENDQRCDLTPLERAKEFGALAASPGFEKRLGRDGAYVIKYLRLSQLIEPFKSDLTQGKLPLEYAHLIARLDAAEQEQVGSIELYRLDGSLMPLGQFKKALHSGFVRSLDGAPWWGFKDFLVGEGIVGPCPPCPHRTSNQPDLFSVLADEPSSRGSCTKPSCYAAKTEHVIQLSLRKAKTELRLSTEDERVPKGCLKQSQWERVAAEDEDESGVEVGVITHSPGDISIVGTILHIRQVVVDDGNASREARKIQEELLWSEATERVKAIGESVRKSIPNSEIFSAHFDRLLCGLIDQAGKEVMSNIMGRLYPQVKKAALVGHLKALAENAYLLEEKLALASELVKAMEEAKGITGEKT